MGTFELSFSLLNLVLAEELRLSDTLVLRPLARDVVINKYLGHKLGVHGIPDWTSAPWRPNHNLEAVYTVPEETDASGVTFADRAVYQLMSAITLSRVLGTKVYASHMVSPRGSLGLRSMGDVTFHPTALHEGQVRLLKQSFDIAGECLADEDVLGPALDRFIKARNESLHGPRVNEPNWDKLAEYVVCMETLFLSEHGTKPSHESLSYRLALNGTSLLHLVGIEDREMTFTALKRLYGIRSTIVHGDGTKKILGEVNKFLSDVKVESEETFSITRLQLASERIELWLYAVFQLLASMPQAERPFAKKRGWEHLVWK